MAALWSTPELANLRRARVRCHAQLRKAAALVESYEAKLAEIEARIHALDPELALPARHRTHQPNPYFARGELPRVALAVLRGAGEPLPIRAIAVQALASRGAKPQRDACSR